MYLANYVYTFCTYNDELIIKKKLIIYNLHSVNIKYF